MTKVSLLTAIKREGEPAITVVTLMKPNVGMLRGMALTDVLRMDVGTLQRLLPRITNPPLMPDEVAALDMADFLSLAGGVVSFFVGPDQRAQLEADARMN
jgi:hypothetical protein